MIPMIQKQNSLKTMEHFNTARISKQTFSKSGTLGLK